MRQSLLIQLGIKECVMQSNEKRSDHDLTTLRTLVERCGVMVTEQKAGEFSIFSPNLDLTLSVVDFQSGSVEQDLNRLLNESNSGLALR